MKVTFHVPVTQGQDQAKAMVMRLFPGSDPQVTQRAIGTSNINWQDLDSLADLLDAHVVYSPFVTFTLTEPITEPSQEQCDFLSQPGIEVQREIDPQELLSQLYHDEIE